MKLKSCLPVSRGSILVYSLIILTMMLAIATTISVTTMMEKKSASSTEFSVQAFQTADSGVQLATKKINANLDATDNTIKDVFPNCDAVSGKIPTNTDGGPTGSNYELSFFDSSNTALTCSDYVTKVYNIKSVGTYKNTVRAVNVAMAANCPSTVTRDGITYGTVKAKDNKCWLDRNLGATRVATSSTDANSYGWFFQWGRAADGHQIPTSGTTTTLATSDTPGHANFIKTPNSPYDWRSDNNNNRWNTGANNPCPTGFRLPTQTEWATLVNAEGITNPATAYGSTLKLSLAGYRGHSNASLYNQGSYGFYWSSSPDGALYAYGLHFVSSGGVNPAVDDYRAGGFSVRCLQN